MSNENATVEREQRSTTTDDDVLVSVRDLKKHYGADSLLSDNPVKAVDGVSFDIHRGETLGLVGESGCGKTTLGRTLVRLETATSGDVQFEDTDITTLSGSDLKQWRRNAQMVFQDPDSSLNERMTVGELIRDPLDVHDWKTKAERDERVRELLEKVGLSEKHYFRYPHQFSGGQRQRIGIARALALEPEFLVLDEPVSALDVSVQAKILNLLRDLQDDLGLTYLLIAHDLSVVRHLADRVAVMYLGHIMELGETERLFENPANPYTHSLLSAIPEPDPYAESDRITLRGAPPSPRNPPEGCPFSTRCPMKIRPEAYQSVDDDAWRAIQELREILRERVRTDRSITVIARELLGLETRISDIDEITEEVFGDVELPPELATHVDRVVEDVSDGNPEDARQYLKGEVGGPCDRDAPDYYTVDDEERTSYCHRHAPEYESPAATLDSE
ncbi:ABC transporter ATP-binding protein [Halolamina sediminis]|jgi:peptide/nickel transport system ATP-binding protein|uniref:ABC transporter ATP-binding protein n=1 Tax=Halolamina sediminis TaxID=1480675 RepID=UPI0006B5550E|nr:ABC transporter ATP-binding protein [Halolamina sediminis]